MTTTADVHKATALMAYLLRALWRRVDWESIPAARRRTISEELRNALVPLAISSRSTLEFLRSLCARFGINETGGSFLAEGGKEVAARPVYALIPRSLTPEGLVEIAHPDADATMAAIPWTAACKAIDFEALRIALCESPAFFATFATTPPVDGEEALFAASKSDAASPAWTAVLPEQLISPRSYCTVWTLTSPMAHGHDEKHGNVVLFRRQRIVSPITGELALVPFLSGNSIRGAWRDMIFGRLLQLVGLTSHDLPPQRAHALLSGGTIEKGADGEAVDVGVRRRASAMSPAWDLFGGVIESQIMRGLLRVHDAVVVCRENAWMLHAFLRPTRDGAPLSFEEFAASLKPADDLTQLRLLTRHAHRDIERSDGSQMIVNTEVLLPGTQIMHRFQIIGLDHVSALARSCMADLLSEFRLDAFVGAQNARGLSAIAFDPYLPNQEAAPLPSPSIYIEWVGAHADEIRTWLLSDKAPGKDEPGKSAPKTGPGTAKAQRPRSNSR